MTRWMLILAVFGCGGNGSNTPDAAGSSDTKPAGLACNVVSYCSTWSANSTSVAAPTERGGTIADGIYRLERGTFKVELLQFSGTSVNSIGDSFQNDSGTYSTADGTITFSYTSSCNRTGTMSDTSTWKDRPYFANGDTLLIAMADSGTSVVWYEYKRVPVDQICTANTNVKCGVTNCSCAVVMNGFGTVMSGVKQCSSS